MSLCACHGSDPSAPAPAAVIQNLGWRANQTGFEGDVLLAQVAEEPGDDRNGDGDTLDAVLLVHDLESGSETTLPFAIPYGFGHGSGLVAFAVSESSQGTDLNGDGSQLESVLVVHDLESGVTTNLGLALKGAPRPYLTQEGARLAFTVSESEQHADLDGDGLATHDLVYTYEGDLQRLTPLGLASSLRPILDQGRVLVAVQESVAGDRNGDGDALDQVLLVREVESGATVDLERAVQPWSGELPRLAVDGPLIALGIDEAAQGADLDQDGGASDVVLEFLDLESETSLLASVPAYDLFAAGGLVGTYAPEDFAGTDHNADGDPFDVVAYFYDGLAGILTNTATAVEPLGLLPFPPALGARRAAFLSSEAAQGEIDQNGDGDTDDYVLQLFEGTTASTLSTGWAAGRDVQVFDIGERHVAFATLGGPPPLGSSTPVPPFVLIHELSTGAERRFELPVQHLAIEGHLLLLLVHELDDTGTAGSDRNGDGDLLDRVVYVHELDGGRTHATGLAVTDFTHLHLAGRHLSVLLSEAAQGGDRNGDGDAFDFVLHVVTLPDAGAAPGAKE